VNACKDCSFFSPGHGVCFEPSTWSQGEIGKIPGDIKVWNQFGNCKLFEPDSLPGKPSFGIKKLKFRLRRFLWGKLS